MSRRVDLRAHGYRELAVMPRYYAGREDAIRMGKDMALAGAGVCPRMNRYVIAAVALFVSAVGGSRARDASQDEREIRRVEAALCQAFEGGDAETLRKDLDPRFTLTSSTGVVTDFRTERCRSCAARSGLRNIPQP
jgi:predicted ATPase